MRKCFVPGILLAVALGMFGDVLLKSGDTVLSQQGSSDLSYFLTARQFGFEQLKQGNLALWNPHVFSGAPFFGAIQPALLYPVNWIYLFLPLGLATNLEMVIHFYLAGLFCFLWCRKRGLSRAGAALSGALFMFSGPVYLRIFGGQLPILAGIAWAPLLFLATDALVEGGGLKWALIGMLAGAMQFLTGHPQFPYFTGLAAAVYLALRVLGEKRGLRPCLWFAGMYGGALLLTAVQFLPAIATASEGVRSRGTNLKFAGISSLPPENLWTLIVPYVFGDMVNFAYFGRWHLWEVTLFCGVGGLALAGYGARCGIKALRGYSGPMVLVFGVLSLGAYTPLFRLLRVLVPGYNLFRVQARFNFIVVLFLSLLAGIGFDHLRQRKEWPKTFARAMLLAGLLLAMLGGLVHVSASGGGAWTQFLKTIDAAGGCFLPARNYQDTTFLKEAGLFAARQIGLAAGFAFLFALALFLQRARRGFSAAIPVLIGCELLFVGFRTKATMELSPELPATWQKVVRESPSEFRILEPNLQRANLGMVLDVDNLWGYDPAVLRRYAEFMSATQGIPPAEATHKVKFKVVHQLYQMLRCKYAFDPDEDRPPFELPSPMRRLHLVENFRVLKDRDKLFQALFSPSFDPRQEVLLESLPAPAPAKGGASGTARVIRSSTDELEILAELPAPALLLVTDSYSKGWRAVPFQDSSQQHYEVMPANYILRSVPLSAGKHHFKLEYMPRGYQAGRWISLVAILLYAAGWMVVGKKRDA